MLMTHPTGKYSFMVGIAPYSCGVVAEPGYEIVHATLVRGIPWRVGFQGIERFLESEGLPKDALCGIQLRCPAAHAMDGFIEFNSEYIQVLRDWKLNVGDFNPIARTNVSPHKNAPEETHLYAFAFVRSSRIARPTFVVAGTGELRDGTLVEQGIIRRGEVSPDALQEKAQYVMDVMTERLQTLKGSWNEVNRINIYTVHPIDSLIREVVSSRIGNAARHGIHWFDTRPPVQEIEFEMDLRGVATELYLTL